MILTPSELTSTKFAAFGQVIAARTSATSEANQGTASRFDDLAVLQNLREGCKSNVCLFRSAKRPLEDGGKDDEVVSEDGSGMFRVHLLERHPYSSQMFVPMNCQKRWLIVVALSKPEKDGVDVCKEGNAGPDYSTMQAFLASSNQGINFAAGVWHHPLIALESDTDFACVVHEDGSSDDCHVVEMQNSVLVNVPPSPNTSKM